MHQLIFLLTLLIALGIFTFSFSRVLKYIRLTRKYEIGDWGKRFIKMFAVAFGQTRIFRFPGAGVLHALTFWGFCIILIGSVEMIIDGIAGTERILSAAGWLYNLLIATGDIFGLIVLLSILVFIFRRLFMNIKRFTGNEMKHVSHQDATLALSLILLLMVSLLGMNTFYIVEKNLAGEVIQGVYPVSSVLATWFNNIRPGSAHHLHEINWWAHILLIFIFANILPYSKHFHVFMSIPNVFLSRLSPLGYIDNMPEITREVEFMMFPERQGQEEMPVTPERFGVRDVQDVTWKNYLDSLTCTECGRCTSVCPANITGKKLSPRKIVMDVRARMKEKGPGLVKDLQYDDGKALLGNYISDEELWACNMCNACANECPVSINHPSLILEMRRYLVMEESKARPMLNKMFTFIENNGAPWQYSPEDRHLWTENLEFNVPLMSDFFSKEIKPEFLLWVGSAGSFDTNARQVTRAFVRILNKLGIYFATLGPEETDSGDVARRSGNEMLFQMQALMNIEVMNNYGVTKIVTCDPHDFNTLKHEYPDLGGHYEVWHHSEFLSMLAAEGKLEIPVSAFSGKKVVYHDPCYLGRANGIYEEPRSLIRETGASLVEMPRNRSFSLCCGAGGGQLFKESEPGDREVYIERTQEAMKMEPDIIATGCPFCKLMIGDGLKMLDSPEHIKSYDIAELVWMSLDGSGKK